MSVDTFIPEIWHAQLMEPLQRKHIYADVTNRDYEGNISNVGDTVRINTVGDVTVSDYVPNSTVITPERLNTADLELVIDTCKYFAFEIDDVDKRQALGGLMPAGMRRAGDKMRNLVDLYIAAFYTGALAANTIGTTAITTPTLALDGLTNLMVKLDEADVPEEGRWAIVTPWYKALLARSQEFIAVSPQEALLNGRVGQCMGFDIRMSNNAPNPTGDDFVVMAGTDQAISFADVVRGMHLYGAKLLRPEFLAILTASKT